MRRRAREPVSLDPGSASRPQARARATLKAAGQRSLFSTLVGLGLVVSLISSLGPPLVPALAAHLHASVAAAQWSLTATLLVGAVSSPIIGRLGDSRHRKQAMLFCLLAVGVGGVLAAVARTLPILIAGRGLQGAGLALVPLAMAAAKAQLPPGVAARAIAFLSVAAAAGVGIGYPLTGLIADGVGTDGAFWFSSAASLVALVICAVVVTQPATGEPAPPVDLVGAATLSAGIVALLLGFELGAQWGWAAGGTLALFAAALVLIAVWARYEAGRAAPLVDVRLLRRRAVATTNAAAVSIGFSMYLSITVMTQFVQIRPHGGVGFGESIFVAGLSLVPLSLCSVLSSAILPRLERRVGIRPLIPAGGCLMACASLFFGLTAHALWEAFVAMAIVGLGVGLTLGVMPALICAEIPVTDTGSALGFYQVSRYVGYSAGSGLSVTLVRIFGGDGDLRAGYRATFVAAGVVCVVAAAGVWLLSAERRDAALDASPDAT